MGKGQEQCPREQEIILAFHDGEPEQARAGAEEHLDRCAACRRALDEVRQLDALVAARTDTDLAEERAEEFLAFLPAQAQGEDPGRVGQRRLMLVAVVLILAAGGVLALVLAGREEQPAQEVQVATSKPGEMAMPGPPAKEEEGPSRPPAPPALVPSPLFAPLVITLPDNYARPEEEESRPKLTDRDYLAAFEGQKVAGLVPGMLEAKLDEVLAEPAAFRPDFVLAAARWTLASRRQLPQARLLALGGMAARARREVAAGLCALVHAHPVQLQRLARLGMKGRSPQARRRARANGALGNQLAIRPLMACSEERQLEAARAAAAAGSPGSLAFLVELHLERATRHSALASPALLFADLPFELIPAARSLLVERSKNTPRRNQERLCLEVEEFLKCRQGGLL